MTMCPLFTPTEEKNKNPNLIIIKSVGKVYLGLLQYTIESFLFLMHGKLIKCTHKNGITYSAEWRTSLKQYFIGKLSDLF